MIYPGQREAPGLTVQVTSTSQVTKKLLSMQPLFLYVPLFLLVQDRAFYAQMVRRVRLAAVLPRVIHDGELAGITRQLDEVYDLGVRHVLLGESGADSGGQGPGVCHLRRFWPQPLQQPVHECHACPGFGQRHGLL